MTETYDQIKQQRDEARAACAEMRLVVRCFAEAHNASAGRMIENALSSDCGKGLLAELERKTKALESLFVSAEEFCQDWRKGDFELPELAQCDARDIEEKLIAASKALNPVRWAVLEKILNPQTK